MPFLPLQLPPGIVRGTNPDDSPDRWYDGNLVRWRDNVMEPVGGWERSTVTPLASKVRKIFQWRRNSNIPMTLLGCDSELYADDSGAFVDVSPNSLVSLTTTTDGGFGTGTFGSSTYGTPRTVETELTPTPGAWSISAWGEDALAVASSDGRLLYFTSANPSTAVKTVGVYSISTISRASDVVTVTTSTAHFLSVGDSIQISGVTNSGFNVSSALITGVTNSTTVTYSHVGSDATSSGGTVRDLSVPTGNRFVHVTPERHVVLLQAGGEPRRVAWSSRENYTDWNFASATNTAGFIDLQSETPLVAACGVREGTIIWSGNRAFLMRYVGQPFIYGVDGLGTTKLLAPNAYAEFDGRCVWMDRSGFMVYEGGTMRPLPCPMTDYIFSNIDPEYGWRVSHASVNGKFDEVWFFYPSSGSSDCDRYVVWNYVDNWWSMGSLARTAAFPAGVEGFFLMAGTDKHLYQHETGWTYDGFPVADNIFIASGTLNLPGDEASWAIQQVVPSNGGNFDLTKYTFYSRQTPNGAERTFGPYYSRSDGYVDTRVSGRDIRIRISANEAGDWSIGRMRLKLGAGGARR